MQKIPRRYLTHEASTENISKTASYNMDLSFHVVETQKTNKIT